MIGSAITHLVESTAFAVLTGLLLAALRVRKPSVRHAAWLLVAIKFALPASIFAALGGALRTLAPQPIPIAWSGSSALLVRVANMPGAVPVAKPLVETAVLCLWLASAIFAMGVWLRRLTARPLQTVPAPAAEAEILRRLRKVAGVHRCVALRHFRQVMAPSIRGIWKPVVCIPETLGSELEPVEFESVLLHELAHARRWDNLSSAVVHAIACVFWFYPMLWWIERKIALEAECACDELVVRCGVSRESYVASILKVCRLQIAAPLAGVSRIGSNLSERMGWILSGRIGGRGGFLGGVAIAIMAAAMTVAPAALGFIAKPAQAAQRPTGIAPVPVPQPTAPAARATQRRKGRPLTIAASVAAQDPKPPEVWCAYMSVFYPEGTVGHNGRSDRMCVADANGDPKWVIAETAGRPRVGEIVDLWTARQAPGIPQATGPRQTKGPPQSAGAPLASGPPQAPAALPFCKVKGSTSDVECACESGRFSLGVVAFGDRGDRLVCDKWSTRKTAEWRLAIQGKDYQ